MRIVGAALAFALAASPAGARCLSYEPTMVHLEGNLAARSVPGPPNYRSIAQGDYPEQIFLLRVADPVCVNADPTSRQNSKSHAGLEEIQLSIPPERVKPFVGKRVRVTGTLFGAQTGHHRTPVLLRAQTVRTAPEPRP
jgi:hypothetical protein